MTEEFHLDAIQKLKKEAASIYCESSNTKRDKKSTTCSNCGGHGHNRRKCPEISISISESQLESAQLLEEMQRKKRKQSADTGLPVKLPNVDPLMDEPDESESGNNKNPVEANGNISYSDIPLEGDAAQLPRPPVMTKKRWEEDVSRLVGIHIPIEIRSTEENRNEGKSRARRRGGGGEEGGREGGGEEGAGASSSNSRNFLRKHCMICRHNTSVCCEQCNTYLCIKESVNKGWNCWKLFHTCKNIVDSEYIPVRKRLK